MGSTILTFGLFTSDNNNRSKIVAQHMSNYYAPDTMQAIFIYTKTNPHNRYIMYVLLQIITFVLLQMRKAEA